VAVNAWAADVFTVALLGDNTMLVNV